VLRRALSTVLCFSATLVGLAACDRSPPEPPAPKQGYEPMEEPKAGTTVHPPSGVELVESIATIAGELASVGLKAGTRLLKDALSPLRKP